MTPAKAKRRKSRKNRNKKNASASKTEIDEEDEKEAMLSEHVEGGKTLEGVEGATPSEDVSSKLNLFAALTPAQSAALVTSLEDDSDGCIFGSRLHEYMPLYLASLALEVLPTRQNLQNVYDEFDSRNFFLLLANVYSLNDQHDPFGHVNYIKSCPTPIKDAIFLFFRHPKLFTEQICRTFLPVQKNLAMIRKIFPRKTFSSDQEFLKNKLSPLTDLLLHYLFPTERLCEVNIIIPAHEETSPYLMNAYRLRSLRASQFRLTMQTPAMIQLLNSIFPMEGMSMLLDVHAAESSLIYQEESRLYGEYYSVELAKITTSGGKKRKASLKKLQHTVDLDRTITCLFPFARIPVVRILKRDHRPDFKAHLLRIHSAAVAIADFLL